jgi:hypothetical protein
MKELEGVCSRAEEKIEEIGLLSFGLGGLSKVLRAPVVDFLANDFEL